MSKKIREYAMYKGEQFVDLGTLKYLAQKYHKNETSLLFLSYPTAHKRSKGNKLLLYEIRD